MQALSTRALVASACMAVMTIPVAAGAASTDAATTRFCDANFRINSTFNEQPNSNAGAKKQKAFVKKLNAVLTRADKLAPRDIAEEVSTAVTALKADLDTAFEDSAVGEAVAAIDQWVADNCGYQTVDVTLEDYSFEGIPSTLDTGKTVFELTNNGSDSHEIILFRIKTDTPIEDLLADEKQAEKESEFVGAGFAEPGDTGSALVDLKKPGRYAAVCFIPVGTHGDTEGDGPPHFTEGMVSEFTVEKA